MFQLDLLRKRNQFVYFTYVFSFILYHIMISANMFNKYFLLYVYFSSFAILINTVLLLLKINPKIQLVTLLISWNISIILLVTESQYLITFYWFIFFILLVTIYRSKLINFIISLICVLEVVLVLFFNNRLLFDTLQSHLTIHIYFLVLLLITGILQMSYIRFYWSKSEKSTLEREIKLSSTEGYLKLFFEQAEDAIAVFDLDEKIITVNPAFERLYGWTKEECIGKSLPLVPPKNQKAATERSKRIFQGEKFRLIETEDMRKDGTYFDTLISLTPIYDKHNEMIAISLISRDISYIKKNEQLMMQSEKLKLAGEIAAGVAHEIRNPLTVISGFIQMMNTDEKSPHKPYMDLIHSEINRIELIIDEFLVLSKPEVAKLEQIEMKQLLADIQKLFSLECKQRNINLPILLNDIDVSIKGNLNQIKQVFINLIKNAIEATQENGEIKIELCKEDDFIYISIKDNGVGIPENVLNRIFEPFYTTKSKGTGLGMMITNKIVTAHNGHIKIRSTVNVGTEIILSFPIAK